tara:strand:+ start:51 stop:542 length:492 start_codon:yes stop_codon:yes gene_type:complete
MKNSKVTSVQPNGTWDGKYGLMYKFEISFENGDVGEYSSKNKEQNKFIIGQQTDYEYTDGKFPKVKPVYIKPDNFNKSNNYTSSNSSNDNRQLLIVRQSSITRAIEFMNLMNPTKFTREQLRQIILEEAEVFEKWVMRSDMQNKVDMIKKSFDAEVKNDDIPF